MRKQVPLASLTTFRIGGRAHYFFDVSSIAELREAILFARKRALPFLILGGGSNILIRDEGFSGVVIRMSIQGVSFEEQSEYVRVIAQAGEVWDSLVEKAVEKNMWGIENLSFIPGSVGAAPIQNIGAYGSEIKDAIESVEVFDTNTLASKILSKDECNFSYRSSIFKTEAGKSLIVTAVTLRLSKNGKPNLSYADVAEYFSKFPQAPTLQEVRQAIIAIRKRKLPDIKYVGTAGSFFKNPSISKEKFEELKFRFPSIKGNVEAGDKVKISAAWLLDSVAHAKEVSAGGAGIWGNHALVFVNKGNATASDILALESALRKKILEETGISLEREVVLV